MNGVTTNYVLDLASPLTQVLSDGTNTYVYGVDRIAQINGTAPEYFLTDGLGSVRQLVDGAGNATLAKSYEPYGTEASSVGNGLSSYGFTGEMTDPTGLIYLRARYLAPDDGRFLTRDSWMGDYNHPLSLNRWNYTDSNPINHTDPSGHCFTATGKDLAANDWSRLLEYPIKGMCKDHSNDVLSPLNDHWHYYPTDNIVCPAYLSCSQEEIGDAMARFAYPGQEPSEPVHDQGLYFVIPFKGTPFKAFGAIRAEVSPDYLTTANIALPTHIFYKGEVHRQAIHTANGDWHVFTQGYGNNIYFEMDEVNQTTGAGIFNNVDQHMRIYIEEIISKTGSGVHASHAIPNELED